MLEVCNIQRPINGQRCYPDMMVHNFDLLQIIKNRSIP